VKVSDRFKRDKLFLKNYKIKIIPTLSLKIIIEIYSGNKIKEKYIMNCGKYKQLITESHKAALSQPHYSDLNK